MPSLILYPCIFLSGFNALVFQVVWQKNLAQILGSEARSTSLVVALFLFGLAGGYRFFGELTRKTRSRRQLLKTYGLIEVGVGLYAVLFPIGFHKLRGMIHLFPDHLLVDFLLTLALLLIPTFLMGASIPLLTMVIPRKSDEVNGVHRKIYGWNTLGAFFGVVFSSFCLIPKFGLFMTMGFAGSCNILIGLVLGMNRLSGNTHKKTKIPGIGKALPRSLVYLFTFVTGSTTIALEVLFVRVFGLTTGSGFWVFPIILGVFVLGLGIGSLTLKKKFSMKSLYLHFVGIGFLGLFTFWSVPYWPYWVHHIRIQLSPLSSAAFLYFALLFLFVSVFLLPLIILLGRLLPVSYSLIKKTGHNFGSLCGRIYFFNTFGTVFGAVVCGYLALNLFQLDTIIRLIFIGVLLVFILVSLYTKAGKTTFSLSLCLLFFVFLPGWDRSSHHVGLFRNRLTTKYSFKGFLKKPRAADNGKVLSFNDGPNTTITVIAYDEAEKRMTNDGGNFKFEERGNGHEEGSHSKKFSEIEKKQNSMSTHKSVSFFVNGKSDGNSLSDYSTATVSGLIPYLYGPSGTDLKALVVGMGTGLTSSLLSSFKDVQSVKTIEISREAIKVSRFLDPFNGGLTKKPKHRFIPGDAFRYLLKTDEVMDIIVSEPSNPWVSGVENLYTEDYYRLILKNLDKKEGVFIQWLQGYSFSNGSFKLILQNIVNSFKDYELYRTANGDYVIVASPEKLSKKPVLRRLSEAFVKEVFFNLALDPRDLSLARIMDKKLIQLSLVDVSPSESKHSLDTPKLNFLAGLDFFSGITIDPLGIPNIEFLRWVENRELKTRLEESLSEELPKNCMEPLFNNGKKSLHTFYCRFTKSIKKTYRDLLKKQKSSDLKDSLSAYHRLRQNAWIGPDKKFLNKISSKISFLHKRKAKEIIPLLAQQYVFELWSKEALEQIDNWEKQKLLTGKEKELLVEKLEKSSFLLGLKDKL